MDNVLPEVGVVCHEGFDLREEGVKDAISGCFGGDCVHVFDHLLEHDLRFLPEDRLEGLVELDIGVF